MEKLRVKVKDDAIRIYLSQYSPSYVPTKHEREWLNTIREMEGKIYNNAKREGYGYFIPYENPEDNVIGIVIPKEMVEVL